jgi:hypothetical protein
MEELSLQSLTIKVSPSHIRVAETLAEQVKKEYEEFLARERAGTLTPRITESCYNCKNDFVKDQMLFVPKRQLWSGVEVKEHYYCTVECQEKNELKIMRKAEEEDERKRLFKFRYIFNKIIPGFT